MPTCLKIFLQYLSHAEAMEVVEYIDENGDNKSKRWEH